MNSEVIDHHFLIYPSFTQPAFSCITTRMTLIPLKQVLICVYLYDCIFTIGTLTRQLSTHTPPHASVLNPPTNFPSVELSQFIKPSADSADSSTTISPAVLQVSKSSPVQATPILIHLLLLRLFFLFPHFHYRVIARLH